MGTPLLYTPAEAADLLKIGKTKLYEEKAYGRIKHVKIGRALRFARSDLEDYIALCRKETETKKKYSP